MDKMEISINGKKIDCFELRDDGVFISKTQIEEMRPIYGSLSVGYYCPSEKSSKKWKVQIGNIKLSEILEKTHLAWFENKSDAENYIKQLDKLLRF